LVEAHDPKGEIKGEMFGLPRLAGLVGTERIAGGRSLIEFLLSELTRFTGDGSRRMTSPFLPWRDRQNHNGT